MCKLALTLLAAFYALDVTLIAVKSDAIEKSSANQARTWPPSTTWERPTNTPTYTNTEPPTTTDNTSPKEGKGYGERCEGYECRTGSSYCRNAYKYEKYYCSCFYSGTIYDAATDQCIDLYEFGQTCFNISYSQCQTQGAFCKSLGLGSEGICECPPDLPVYYADYDVCSTIGTLIGGACILDDQCEDVIGAKCVEGRCNCDDMYDAEQSMCISG